VRNQGGNIRDINIYSESGGTSGHARNGRNSEPSAQAIVHPALPLDIRRWKALNYDVQTK
jgi:hypothetical protein